MNVHSVKDLSNRKLINFLKRSLTQVDDYRLIKNYHPDYQSTPGNLFYILKEGRYKTGNYFIMEDGGKFYGSAGWNEYDDVALVLTRAYIPKGIRGRNIMSKYLFPIILKETEEYNRLWITFNDYNSVIYQGFVRQAEGKSNMIWPEEYKKFVPIGKRTVYYTDQYVVEYKK